MRLTTAVELSDTAVELGTLNFSTLGITSIYFSMFGCLGFGDASNGIVTIDVNANSGVVTSTDIISKDSSNSISANKDFYCDFTVPINRNNMLDSATGEFHFKRIA